MSSHPLEIIHTDLCGPTKTKILQGDHYFMLLINDYTRMTWVTFLKEKLEATYMELRALNMVREGT